MSQKKGANGANEPKFELAKDKEGNWQWVLWSSNGRALATSAAGYNTPMACKNAIRIVIDACATRPKTCIAPKTTATSKAAAPAQTPVPAEPNESVPTDETPIG